MQLTSPSRNQQGNPKPVRNRGYSQGKSSASSNCPIQIHSSCTCMSVRPNIITTIYNP